jgi:hypothetical protein
MAAEFTKFQAETIAKWDRNYVVRPVRGKPGHYMVWDSRSDHHVEVDRVFDEGCFFCAPEGENAVASHKRRAFMTKYGATGGTMESRKDR